MLTIGRKDKLDLPEFGLIDIEAKIDTGAFGCALHCHHIETFDNDNGVETLRFSVLDPDHKQYEDEVFQTVNFYEKSVKSSSGEAENRYVIKTEVILFGQKQHVEFSLTDRSSMKCPILLGRKFLSKKFLVDVQLKDESFKKK